ncbi:ribulokinase [Nocardioides dongxiaopingii]|uniref:ribulokinase n=1 Tax=Nocardioides dongxiaopingii TaxID=2576036 RepID=UPI0010C76190|nr:ribulokinase [Nocardioides dongxiaopingii]
MTAPHQPPEQRETYVVGVDFGTLSGRALVVRVSDGAELGTATHDYPHGVLEDRLPTSGRALPPEWALQVPQDYRDVLRHAVPAAVAAAGVDPADVVGIATDFTACTMVPTLADGTPLSEVPGLEDRPHAYVKLWKHHAAQAQADRINRLAEERGEAWLPRYGGLISSEWEFAKGLQVYEEDRDLYDRMQRWVEAADWIVWQLCGTYVRNACTAGYKGILQSGRYPGPDYLDELAPGFSSFVPDKLDQPVGQLGERAGTLTAEAAAWTGLPAGTAVAVGNVDAHVTAPAAQAVDAGQMVAIMGTSTCHVMSADVLREVPGMCGVVDGGIVAGSWGYEAGQSGVGDIFGWFTRTSVPPSYVDAAAAAGESVHEHLTRLASAQEVGEHGLVALDWHSGNRSVLVDHELSGLVVGQTLATRPEDVYRALLEATAFGTRVIVETFRDSGVPVDELVVAGGLARNHLLMQVYADVTRLPLSLIDSEQGPALGSAIHAAVAAGAYPDVPTAAKAMGRVRRGVFVPDEARAQRYDALFAEYVALHDHFGRGNPTMRRLKAIRRDAVQARRDRGVARA